MWKAVVGYEGIYEVSNNGDLRNIQRGNKIKSFPNAAGYYRVNLCKNGERKAKFVHRIVAEAFLENPCMLQQVNHKDENPANNSADNLEWCNAAYNSNYGNHAKNISKNRKNKGSRPVVAVDPATGVVISFPSLHEAERNGHKANCVWAAINNAPKNRGGVKRTYHGYVWRYA